MMAFLVFSGHLESEQVCNRIWINKTREFLEHVKRLVVVGEVLNISHFTAACTLILRQGQFQVRSEPQSLALRFAELKPTF